MLGCQYQCKWLIDWKDLVSKMTYDVLMGTLSPTHSLTHSLIKAACWACMGALRKDRLSRGSLLTCGRAGVAQCDSILRQPRDCFALSGRNLVAWWCQRRRRRSCSSDVRYRQNPPYIAVLSLTVQIVEVTIPFRIAMQQHPRNIYRSTK